MQYDSSPYGQLARIEAIRSAQRENSARLAKSHAKYRTVGFGESRAAQVFDFDIVFTGEPTISYGHWVDVSGDNPDLSAGRYPRAHGGVWQWRTQPSPSDPTRMFYTGAWVYFVVDVSGLPSAGASGACGPTGPTVGPAYVVNHHLSFEGVALKSVPGHLLEL